MKITMMVMLSLLQAGLQKTRVLKTFLVGCFFKVFKVIHSAT